MLVRSKCGGRAALRAPPCEDIGGDCRYWPPSCWMVHCHGTECSRGARAPARLGLARLAGSTGPGMHASRGVRGSSRAGALITGKGVPSSRGAGAHAEAGHAHIVAHVVPAMATH